jgi:hypothetical protein
VRNHLYQGGYAPGSPTSSGTGSTEGVSAEGVVLESQTGWMASKSAEGI